MYNLNIQGKLLEIYRKNTIKLGREVGYIYLIYGVCVASMAFALLCYDTTRGIGKANYRVLSQNLVV